MLREYLPPLGSVPKVALRVAVMYARLVVLLVVAGSVSGDFRLQIFHINDFHARFEPVHARYSNRCLPGTEETCLGGISRIFNLTKEIKSRSSNTIVLNAGDNYQGTLWYTLFKWNVTAKFLGQVPFDVNVLGNHDFDDEIKGLTPFLERVPFPSVVANMDMSEEPSLLPFINKSVVLEREGKKIGVIGYVLHRFPEMSRTGKLKFSDEATAVNEEAAILKQQGVDIIIALSHAGVLVDIEVAQKANLVDVIVGGHSHTFMYTGTQPSYDKPLYQYPHVVNQDSGRKVLVVQAGAYSRYLGNLTVTFDDAGEVIDYGGNPILLDKTIRSDPAMDLEMEPWKSSVDAKGQEVLGYSSVDLQGSCYSEECNMGNFVTDGMVHSFINSDKGEGQWTSAAIAIINAGGLRTSIPKGNVTYADVLTVVPFGGTVDAVSLKGSSLIKVIEHTLNSSNFVQWSGALMTVDSTRPVGERVVDLKLVCTDCDVPELQPVVLDKYYRVLIPSFLYHGGDGYVVFEREGVNHTVGGIDSECFIDFLKRSSPVVYGIDGRLHLVKAMKTSRMHSTIFSK